MLSLRRMGLEIFKRKNILVRRCSTFTDSGEWIKTHNNVSSIGLSKNSIEQLNELVYIDPMVEIGDEIKIDDTLISLESVKAVESINAFSDCKIVDINYDLFDNLDIINTDPENFETSWIIKTDP